MADIDELDLNPFFKALQGKYLKQYEEAQEKCGLICVPCAKSLHGITITQTFVETHLLRASPFYKGQFMTEHSKKSVVFEGNSLGPIDGFHTEDKVRIINEELGYNREEKPYRILILEKPLDAGIFRMDEKNGDSATETFKAMMSLKECRGFLQSYPEFSKVLKELDESLMKFNKNYMLLTDYLEDACLKLETTAYDGSEKCLKCCKHKLWMNPTFRDTLSAAIETYTMATVHPKVYPVICSKYPNEDRTMADRYRRMVGLKAETLGVPTHFCCPVPSAVAELEKLDKLLSPIEKLYCIKATFDNITDDINAYVLDHQHPGISSEEPPCLTSDDFIPILVTVLIQARCPHLHSNIYYMENFYWAAGGKDRDNLSYCLVTFKAAVQYLMIEKFDSMDLRKNISQNEISIDKLMAAKWEHQQAASGSTEKEDDQTSRISPKARIHRQMENISRMLEETGDLGKKPDLELQPTSIFGGYVPTVSLTPQPKSETKDKKEEMGDFLSSLQDDMFIGYGKQS